MTTRNTFAMGDQTTVTVETPPLPTGGGDASLVLLYGGELGRRYPLGPESEIGRASFNEVVIEAESVSRRHASVTKVDKGYEIRDLGSTNGTVINGVPIEGPRLLDHGDLIKIGGVVLRFISGDDLEARYHEEIYRLTIVDGLTQIHNRRYFDEFLDRETARSERSGTALALVLFDVDDFKQLNDEHGHLFGDRFLKEIAARIQKRVRREQLLARFGGDEFALVLPDVEAPDALQFAESIRSEIETLSVDDGKRTGRATVSLGVASWSSGMDRYALIDAADRALLESKGAGRNRVTVRKPGDSRSG